MSDRPDDIPQDVWDAGKAVAEAYDAVIAEAVAAERERCAGIAEGLFPPTTEGRKVPSKTQQIVHAAGNRIAVAIRNPVSTPSVRGDAR